MSVKRGRYVLECPILTTLTNDPVVAEDGEVYDGESLRKYITASRDSALDEMVGWSDKVRSPLLGTMMGTNFMSAPCIRRQMQMMYERNGLSKEQRVAWRELEEERANVLARSDEGDPDAMALKAAWISRGGMGLAHDEKQAIDLYERAARAGSLEACFVMSEFHRRHSDVDLMLHYLRMAAAHGSQKANYCLGLHLRCMGDTVGSIEAMRQMLLAPISDSFSWQRAHAIGWVHLNAVLAGME